MSFSSHPLVTSITDLMIQAPLPWDEVLALVTKQFDCPVGTVHMIGSDDGMLHLRAQVGLPPFVIDKVQVIPVGKGMAGIAAERKEPVQVCNLQTDDSGVARPGAKMTQMEGSLAAPMMVDGEVRGVLGVAKPSAYDFSSDETSLLLTIGALLGKA
ncbi:MAG: L-methionine (R)-S-oxide reductase [Hyphomicrobiaceae bacterium]|jgi:L-methionine (R)-S-oxide reductase